MEEDVGGRGKSLRSISPLLTDWSEEWAVSLLWDPYFCQFGFYQFGMVGILQV